MSQEKVAFAKAIVKCAGDISAGEYANIAYNPFADGNMREKRVIADQFLAQPYGPLKSQAIDFPANIAGGALGGALAGRLIGGKGTGRYGALYGAGMGLLMQPFGLLGRVQRAKGLRKHPEFAGRIGRPRALKDDEQPYTV